MIQAHIWTVYNSFNSPRVLLQHQIKVIGEHYKNLSILQESYCNIFRPPAHRPSKRLSILQESYCNPESPFLLPFLRWTFNSPRVLLQHALIKYEPPAFQSFNSPRVLLQHLKRCSMRRWGLTFNSPRVLLQRWIPEPPFFVTQYLSILQESYCNPSSDVQYYTIKVSFQFSKSLIATDIRTGERRFLLRPFNSPRVLLQLYSRRGRPSRVQSFNSPRVLLQPPCRPTRPSASWTFNSPRVLLQPNSEIR